MEIRIYRETDFAEILQLNKKALIAINAWKGDGPWDEDFNRIANKFSGENGLFLVAVATEQIVGMGGYQITSSFEAEIRGMRVDPEYQGRKIASQIYMELEQSVVSRGIKRIYLDTGVMQFSARKMYEKFGFKEFDLKTIWGMNCVLYEKWL